MRNSMTVSEAKAVMKTIAGLYIDLLVGTKSGKVLDTIDIPGNEEDVHIAAASITEVVQTEKGVIHSLRLDDVIDDILISGKIYYHVIRPFEKRPDIYIYCSINRSTGNLVMAPMIIRRVENNMEL